MLRRMIDRDELTKTILGMARSSSLSFSFTTSMTESKRFVLTINFYIPVERQLMLCQCQTVLNPGGKYFKEKVATQTRRN
eukprot:COSAG06_NODE_1445_length_9452_cov_6.353897_5_plen_80_part_00